MHHSVPTRRSSDRHGFRSEKRGVAKLAHHQWTDAQGIAAGDHAVRRHADEGIGAFDLLQRIDELVEQGAVGGCGDQVNDDFGVVRGLEDGTAPDKLPAVLHRIGHRSEEHTSELQPLMRSSYAVFCLTIIWVNTHNRDRKSTSLTTLYY